MPNIMKGFCPKSGKYYLYEIETVEGKPRVTNFLPVTKTQYDAVSANAVATETAPNLQGNPSTKHRIFGESDFYNPQRCNPSKAYTIQCAYCRQMQLEKGAVGKNLEDCVIEVSSSCFDDIGAVLSSMGVRYRPLEPYLKCDLLFLNCGTSDPVDPNFLREFVERGGILYASDFAVDYLDWAFPGLLKYRDDTDECKVEATVLDPEIAAMVGKRVRIHFDLDVWKLITAHRGETLMVADIPHHGRNVPIMVKFQVGQGTIFYTSFHNHETAGSQELNLLKAFLCKQLGAGTKKSASDVAALLGLNLKV